MRFILWQDKNHKFGFILHNIIPRIACSIFEHVGAIYIGAWYTELHLSVECAGAETATIKCYRSIRFDLDMLRWSRWIRKKVKRGEAICSEYSKQYIFLANNCFWWFPMNSFLKGKWFSLHINQRYLTGSSNKIKVRKATESR